MQAVETEAEAHEPEDAQLDLQKAHGESGTSTEALTQELAVLDHQQPQVSQVQSQKGLRCDLREGRISGAASRKKSIAEDGLSFTRFCICPGWHAFTACKGV